jgi:hypothetical protein
VLSGLFPDERVVVGSRSEFRPGDLVSPKVIANNNKGNF